MRQILWLLTAIGAAFGAFTLFETLIKAESGPQQAAGAAIAVGCAVIPYCFARAVAEIIAPPPDKIVEELVNLRKTVEDSRAPGQAGAAGAV